MKTPKSRNSTNERGSTMLMPMLFIIMAGLISVSFFLCTVSKERIIEMRNNRIDAFYLQESGGNMAPGSLVQR